MGKEDLIKQIYDAMTNGDKEIKKVKIKYQTGGYVKYDFEDGDVEEGEEEEN